MEATKQLLIHAYTGAVRAADPARATAAHLPERPTGRLVVMALGKAAASMARAAVTRYGQAASGIVITPDGEEVRGLSPYRGGHPLPDEGSVAAGRALLELAGSLGPDDLALVLLSGGGSALATVPHGLTLEELRSLTDRLLLSGAAIAEINLVRSRYCLLKAGGLAAACAPARVVSLVLSDVVGDDLRAIASGPTTADPDADRRAENVLQRLGVPAPAPFRPAVPEVPVMNRIVAGNSASLEEAATLLAAAGFDPRIISDSIDTASEQAARDHADLYRTMKPGEALLSGGETSVQVTGHRGSGGRNSHFMLQLAISCWDEPGIFALAADTDGIDGSPEAAGAFVTPGLFRMASLAEARDALRDHDSHTFFLRHDHALPPGATGTNVNDFRVLLRQM